MSGVTQNFGLARVTPSRRVAFSTSLLVLIYTMTDRLPEELLREILSHALLVFPVDFLGFPGDRWSPRLPPRRHSQLLLVSKRWNRVGTPLLYESLDVSGFEQTANIANVLRARPALGRAVRCLRLAERFGKDLVHIAKHTPNVHSLYINLRVIGPGDPVSGVPKALPRWNPVNLYIVEQNFRDNASSVKARKSLYAHIAETWTALRTLALSDFSAYQITKDTLGETLIKSTVEEFNCDSCDVRQYLIKEGNMEKILKNSRIQRVVCRGLRDEEDIRKQLEDHGLAAEARKFSFVHSATRDN
ncbi:hypothetical protein PsYK624_080800 [Phanerochaete sordida]|uniref:F-box domain-containing protein n=1 Tax=Phanerochaete sordida TaxID=48140 RepID=A0A9P3GBN7_9APHY|nr:hypothetical protein PsYK624_080800 [Phanerochaete sordida]